MAALVVILVLISIIALKSVRHALGLWLVIMIAHGFLVGLFGSGVIHLPLFTGLLILVFIVIQKQWRPVQNASLLIFGILTVIMLLAAVQGLDTGRSAFIVLLYLKVFMLALLIGGVLKTDKDVKMLTLYCLAGTVFGALIAIYQYKTGAFALQNIYVERAGGLSSDPNDTAMLLLAGVPIAVYWAHVSEKLTLKVFFLICILVLLFGLILTGSRGGFVSLVLVAMIFYFRKPTIKASFVGIILVITAVIIAPQSYKDRIGTLVTGQDERGKSLESRSTLLKTGIKAFFNHPVLGVGAGNYSSAFNLAKGMKMVSNTGNSIGKSRNFTAHNMYLEFFIENGLIGGLLLLSIFYMSIKNLFTYDKGQYGNKISQFSFGFCTSLALLGMLFACLFLSQGKNPVLWFLVGIGLAVANIKSSGHVKKVEKNENVKINNDGVIHKKGKSSVLLKNE